MIVGLVALRKGLTGDQGLVTQLPLFGDLDLADWRDVVIGGHEIRSVTLYDEAMKLHRESHAIDDQLIARCKSELDRIDRNIVPGTLLNVGSTIEKFADEPLRKRAETPREAIERIQQDLKQFRETHQLDSLVVINVASTEPPIEENQLPARWKDLEKLLDKPARKCPLPASSIYAIAALDLGLPYINFTPSLGSAAPAICELAARARHVPHGARRQDGRNAHEERARADVRAAQPAGAELGGAQHLRQHGRQGAGRSGQQEDEGARARTGCCTRSWATARRRW